MPLAPGHKLGPYEIVAPLGEGGMGEVYRAKDSKLKREVALKVLPAEVANDRERLARFQREAEVLASLNHPHIAQVYGLEDGALVMELVEGEDLSRRIARGPIAIDEALPIARQIAEALEAAHDAGIVHRDLKPANVKVRPDGTVKVLDFGLAKAGSAAAEAAALQTITSPAMTMRGVILGTAAYMAPEQAKGRFVDRRADIWAFGCVLLEMLTGARAFAGDDVSETMVSILRDDPRWAALPPETPPHVRLLLRRCLQKDPQKRLPHIGAARIELADADTGELVQGTRPTNRWRLAALLGAIAGAAAVGLIVWLMRTPGAGETGAVRFAIDPGAGHLFPGAVGLPRFAISPDGRQIVYQLSDNKISQLWLRAIDAVEPRPLAGTIGDRVGLAVQQPFWSPDGRYIAYFDEPKAELKKLDLASGLVQTVAGVAGNQSMGAWNDAGDILVSTVETRGIQRLPAGGGAPVNVTMVDEAQNEYAHLWPEFLPDGRHFVYLTLYLKDATPVLWIASVDGGVPRRLMESRTMARMLWPDRLVFVRDGALLSQRLDLRTFALEGEPELVAKAVTHTPSGRIGASASRTGALVYSSGIAETDRFETYWVNRSGGALADGPPPVSSGSNGIRLSANGRTLLFGRGETGLRGQIVLDLWIQDTVRGIETRVVAGAVVPDATPVLAADGTSVLVRQAADLTYSFREQPLSTNKPTTVLFTGNPGENVMPIDWSRDRRSILFFRSGSRFGERALWILPVGGKPVEYLRGLFRFGASISPDGRWLAYALGAERSESQVFIQSFPDPSGQRWPVSAIGATFPRWRQDGREIFFVADDAQLMAAPVTTSPAVEIGAATPLFPLGQGRRGGDLAGWSNAYDVSPDGTRFVVMRPRNLDTQRVQLIVTIPPK
jgi:hypothetical protein